MRSRGDKGEGAACIFLQRKSYKILLNNYCVRGGEIDIVACAPDGCVIFVEVKVRSREPIDHRIVLPRAKRAKIWQAARQFLLHANIRSRIRFDLMLIVPNTRGRARLFWYQNLDK